MATTTQILELRSLVAEPLDAAPYTDAYMAQIIDSKGSVEGAAALVWNSKAAALSMLVNISEGGSSRSNSDLHKNALTLAAKYELLDGAGVNGRRTRTRGIERA